MRSSITACPLQYQGETRIKIELSPNDWDAINKIKSMPGRKWSRTYSCWHVPHTEGALQQLKILFGDKLEARQLESLSGERAGQAGQTGSGSGDSRPAPLQGSGYLADIQPQFRIINQYGSDCRIVVGDRLALLRSASGWIQAFVPHDKKNWIGHIKSIPGRRWDAGQRCWLLPMTAESIHAIQDFFGELAAFGFAIPEELPERWAPSPPHKRAAQKPRLGEPQRRAISALEEQLILEGKRQRTVNSYRGILAGLLLHYPKIEPANITLEQINGYIIYKKKSAGISDSTHNQIINALNAYFGRVLNQNDKVQKMKRPRKRRKLPNVLSKGE
ncbi:MAG: phage integrase N-terminal SAM-like domain-containing protein, partial [Phaeodactylibacter sp.]|nr:phage integrase N-terminal SAM-like domain-containing protein [Phaeodactylibacter sp.]